MASLNVDVNSWPSFILRWLFAGLWGCVGWALATRFVLPNIPGF